MSAPGTSRAERFEDEKRRIIESCFSKRDEDGSLLENYITHLRILEFSSHPTSPPPPQARTPATEKPRVIVVAVRRSGRVRVHKTKENLNGTFSIGKTWNFDDLAAVESYTGPNVPPDSRQWAGDTGFLVTLGKPYYWEAQTDKEKKFFIASLIKIYSKYTGGLVPSLSNFEQRELDQILGGASRRPAATLSPGRPPLPPPPSQAQPGHDAAASPEYARTASRSPLPPNGNSSPSPSLAPSVDSARNLRSQDSSLMRQRLAANNMSQDSVANSHRSADESLRPRSRGRPNGTSPHSNAPEPPPPNLPLAFTLATSPRAPAEERPPPERKRPPMDPSRPTGLPPDDALVPAPLISSNLRRIPSQDPMEPSSPVAPPPRSIERMSPRKPPPRFQRNEAPIPPDLAIDQPAEKDAARAVGQPPQLDSAPPPLSVSTDTITNDSPALPDSASTLTETSIGSPMSPEEEHRPGLGPMIKTKKSKNTLAGALWKAAAASSPFKPRVGGAGEKLLKAVQDQSEGPDGITAVVPAPPRPKSIEKKPDQVPEVKISSAESRVLEGAKESTREVTLVPKKTSEPGPESKDERQRSIVVGNDLKYLTTLGIDPTVLDNKTAQFSEWLDFFSWVPGEQMRVLHYDDMKLDIERELNKAQAGGWLARFQEEDERVDAIKKGIDVAVDECEELDNLLTLYSVELSTLQDDIAYIEAQGQGLQVQAANQKLLKRELESLLETCAITANDLQALSVAPLESASGVEEVENALVTLYKAMLKIDPSMGSADAAKTEDGSDQAIDFNGDYAKMRVVQEKKQMYMQESAMFMQRLVDFMGREFNAANDEVRKAMKGALNKKVDPQNHDIGRIRLWKYDPLMLYARDVDMEAWNRLIHIYEEAAQPPYKMEFRDGVDLWKRGARKPTGEAALLFTMEQEKKEEGLATAARKLTVKKSQTLARIRSPHGDSNNKPGVNNAIDLSSNSPYEIFGSMLDDVLPLVEMEQNFMIDFFHASTLEQLDFPDAAAAVSPQHRRGNDLRRLRFMEPDRDLARKVTRSMESIFPFLERELANLVDWVLAQSPLQGIGVIASLERKLSDIQQSNQDFLNGVLQKLHGNLLVKFKRFVEEQIRAIEETKVKINKRKGVISFMRVFPPFSMAMENMLVGIDPQLNVRRTVDREYNRIIKSMFDSLKVIARENPAVGVSAVGPAATADPEDKEALNYHVLLIENMNHFIEEVDTREVETLEKWKRAASDDLKEHVDRYLDAVMRRPLGKLLDTLENIEGQLKSGKSPSATAAQPSNNKATFDRVLLHYDAREVRKGIEALRKRVEKHFDENESLAVTITRACELYYADVEQRISKIVTDLYGGEVLVEWPRLEVKNAFR